MNQILDAPVATEQKLEYAGFWIRVVSAIIDGVILWVVNMVVSFALLGASLGSGDFTGFGAALFLSYAINIAINVAYFSLLESSTRQATLGKMAVGIKVADESGQRLTLANAVGRAFGRILSFLILFIGVIMVAFDDKRQGLHDKLAKTIVYYG